MIRVEQLHHRGLKSQTIKGFRRLSALWQASSDMDRIVAMHRGRLLNKWQHYFEIYARHFEPYRGREITLLEIGVESGGSLELWRSYFGPKARIVGIDINPKCKAFETQNTVVRIGSQGDDDFLRGVAREFGPFDIVIEDGSHTFAHQIGTFRALFDHVRSPGIYCCEDTCTSYWPDEFDGGVGKPGTAVEFFKTLIDEQNGWFWRDEAEQPVAKSLSGSLHGLHFYPTLVVIEKRDVERPTHTPVGRRERAP